MTKVVDDIFASSCEAITKYSKGKSFVVGMFTFMVGMFTFMVAASFNKNA